MKKGYYTIILLMLTLWLTCVYSQLSAQEKTNKDKLDFSADIMSRYIWRGLNLGGSSPSIQPNLEFSYGNFALGAWGAYSFSNTLTRQESDLYLSYTAGDLFNFTVTDYFFPYEDTIPNEYFNFNRDETGHLIELSAKFLGTEKLPLSLMVATNIYGADAKKSNGKNQYSTYFELGYSFKVDKTSCNAFLGFTPNKPDAGKGETGFYGNGPGFINLGITANKDIRITDSFTLPVSTSLITNPQAENIFLVFGITL